MTNHRGIPSTPKNKKSNSPFKWHGIEHLSVSQINSWVSSPSIVLYKLAGGKDGAGPSAWRGQGAEVAFHNVLQNPKADISIHNAKALDEYDRRTTTGFSWTKIDKERHHMLDYVNAGVPTYQKFRKEFGEPTSYQQRFEITFDEIEIPFIGYIDFEFGKKGKNHQIRDCKTSLKRLNKLNTNHCRQLALYQRGIGDADTELWIDSVTRHEVCSLRLTHSQQWLNDLLGKAIGFRKFLSISSDIQELLPIIQPDYEDWKWNSDEMRKQAKVIWEKKID